MGGDPREFPNITFSRLWIAVLVNEFHFPAMKVKRLNRLARPCRVAFPVPIRSNPPFAEGT